MSFNDKNMISSLIYKIEEKINFFIDKPIFSLFIIGAISLAIRLLFFEPEIPIRQDANAYFWYAIDMSILNYFPNLCSQKIPYEFLLIIIAPQPEESIIFFLIKPKLLYLLIILGI